MPSYKSLMPNIYFDVRTDTKSVFFYLHGKVDDLKAEELRVILFGKEIGRCKLRGGRYIFKLPINLFPLDVLKSNILISDGEGTSISWYSESYLSNYPMLNEDLDGYYLTKKGQIKPIGYVFDRLDEYYELYIELSKVFKEFFGYSLLISHGTLLGLYRENKLIANDDDFDTCFISSKTDVYEIKEESLIILAKLRSLGYKVSNSPYSGNLRVRVADVSIDIMPAWFENGNFAISNFTYFSSDGFDASVVESRFAGKIFEHFKSVELFLANQYGVNWRTPDPTFRYVLSGRCEEIKKILRASDSEVLKFGRIGALKQLAIKLSSATDQVPTTKSALRKFISSKIS
jgi:hypothetical protein